MMFLMGFIVGGLVGLFVGVGFGMCILAILNASKYDER